MEPENLTIAGLARQAQVGIETVRYYERRGLVPQPAKATGAYRRYNPAHVGRIRFIKRAQTLGFSLHEIATLLQLEDGADRRGIRRIATARLAETRHKINDLRHMDQVLKHLLHECEAHDKAPRCSIIAAIAPGGR